MSKAKQKQHNLIYIEIGNRIKKHREFMGYSQGQLASGLGLTRTSIVNIEKGRQCISVEALLKVAAILKCTPGSLLPKTPQATAKEISKVKKVVHEKLLSVDFKW
jgi:transcriptional regulator with XRE-family HTH domain